MKNRISKLVVSVFVALAFCVGAQAHAAALTSEQIQAVVGLLESFNVDSATINYVTMSLGGSTLPPSTSPASTPSSAPTQTSPQASGSGCAALTYNLSVGSTDTTTEGQVSSLQKMLGINPTGYFGTMTQEKLANFQADQNIPAVGVMGPITRRALARWCGNSTNPIPAPVSSPTPAPLSTPAPSPEPTATTQGHPVLAAAPVSDMPPLTVSFNARDLSASASYVLNFGDGSQQTLVPIFPPCAFGSTCSPMSSASHTYAAAGTYTATLTNPCPSTQPQCPNAVLGSATITVTGSTQTSPSLSATPTSGAAPLAVTFNASGLGAAFYTYVINFGDGSQQSITAVPPPPCAVGVTCSASAGASHTYSVAGTYTAILSNPCPTTQSQCPNAALGSATITVTGSTQTSPSLSAAPTSGAVPLIVSFNARDLSASASYVINFGDGAQQTVTPVQPPCAFGNTCSPMASASHTYAAAGTYTATLTSACPATQSLCPNAVLGSVTVTVASSNTDSCQVTNIYAQQVPGFNFSNLYMTVHGLTPGSSTVSIAGATDSWNNLGFTYAGMSGNDTLLQANQTINDTGITYLLSHKSTIKPVSNGGASISCNSIN